MLAEWRSFALAEVNSSNDEEPLAMEYQRFTMQLSKSTDHSLATAFNPERACR